MTFDNSVKTCLRKSFTFKGRASRSEYWYFWLFLLLFIIVGGLFAVAIGTESDSTKLVLGIVGLVYVCCLPAAISVEVRRFHDINRSGWNFWWGLIPYLGELIILYFMVQPSDAGENDYGSMPNEHAAQSIPPQHSQRSKKDTPKSSHKFLYVIAIAVVAAVVASISYCYLTPSKQERFVEAERILEGKVLGPKGTSTTDSVYLPADTLSALPVMKELAEDEYGPAMYYMAKFTAHGLAGIEKDSVAAIEMYKKAAAQLSKEAQDGDMYAQCSLALMYSSGDGVSEDDRLSFNWMQKAADQGYDDAQSNLGDWYSYGIGVEENDHEAFKWWKKAAAQQHPDAMLALGIAYYKGTGVAENNQAAFKCFEDLSNREYVPAYYWLADYYTGEEDYGNAKTYYEKAANNSDWRGYFGLGMMYMNGSGVKEDLNAATSYLESGYEGWQNSTSWEGVAEGLYTQLLLADCYYEKKKYTKAFNLFKKLADVDEPAEYMQDAVAEAQYMVAVCYLLGNGCKQSFQKAEEWRKRALANGYQENQ